MRKLALCILCLGLVSCSTTGNYILHSKAYLKSGSSKDKNWYDNLEFQRYSYYSNTLMGLDFYGHILDFKSPFTQWIDKDKKDKISEHCSKILLILAYNYNAQNLDVKNLYVTLENNNNEELELKELFSAIRNHPDYKKLHLRNYKEKAYCLNENKMKSTSLGVDYPGFPTLIFPLTKDK